jgi:hypothetical protein
MVVGICHPSGGEGSFEQEGYGLCWSRLKKKRSVEQESLSLK